MEESVKRFSTAEMFDLLSHAYLECGAIYGRTDASEKCSD